MANNNNELDTTFIKIIQENYLEMRDKSCNGEEMKIAGECYVNKNNSFLNNKKKEFLTFVAGLVVAGSLFSTFGAIGNVEFTDEIRDEALRKITVQELIGGGYDEVYAYGDDFVKHIKGLDDKELRALVNATSDEMKEEGLDKEYRVVEKVVEEMASNYSEANDYSGVKK